MLLVGLSDNEAIELSKQYQDHFIYLNSADYKTIQGKSNSEYPINFLEAIKTYMSRVDVTFILYSVEIIACLMTLKIPYKLVYYSLDNNDILSKLDSFDCDKECLDNINLAKLLYDKYNYSWIAIPNDNTNLILPENKNKLTFEQLLREDVEISEADVRELKATQNKLKVGMLLQAKSSLNRVLKLSNVLDKLYDKLLERIDEGLDTTDTASLMYTTEYISKALNDTNQFIVSLISNEKIQNFFIIDNSSVINVTDDRVALDKREKIRKATEIVLDNIDYFTSGDFDKMRNPNEVIEEDNNADTTT